MANKKTKVLVVEDNEINAMVLENMLKHFDLEVDIAYSGFEAIEKSQDKEYDLILVDYIMPKMDGIETTKGIRKVQLGNPLIYAVTADIQKDIYDEFVKNGANGAVEKPVKADAVKEILKKSEPQQSTETINNTQTISRKSYIESTSEIEDEVVYEFDNIFLKEIFSNVEGLDFDYGIRFSINDENSYIRLIRASIINIDGFLKKLLSNGFVKEENSQELRLIFHSLRSVLLNIGIKELSLEAYRLEEAVNKNDFKFIEYVIDEFVQKLVDASNQLKQAIDTYDKSLLEEESLLVPQKEVTKEEYKEMVRQVMVPLERYEIEFIKDNLKKLLLVSHSNNKKLIEEALLACERFDYDLVKSLVNSLEF